MTDADLRNLVRKRRDASVEYMGEKQRKDRQEALAFYRGDNLDLYGDSGAGRSTVVSRDTMEAIESMMPALIKPFVAGDEVVRYEPVGPEDEEASKQATEYVNYLFSNHNDSFRVIYDLAKDGLLYRVGVAKVTFAEVSEYTTEKYQGLSPEEVEALRLTKDATFDGEPALDAMGFSVTIKIETKRKRYNVAVVSPDEWLIEQRLSGLDDASFVGHKKRVTVGDLIAMGLPRAKCLKLKSSVEETQERSQRFDSDESDENRGDDDLARIVQVVEAYVRCDYEGRGELCWRKVILGGNDDAILLNEEASGHPFVAWTPIPVPHKLVGMSIHDLTRDLQMQTTALWREMLNNLYLVNRPQRTALEGQVNMQEATNPEVGQIIRIKQPNALENLVTPFVANASFPMIEYMNGIREQRTGSTRYNQGMDANSLNKTATGITSIMNAATQRLELVARQFAEGAMKGIFRKMLELVCKHGDKAEVIRLRGEWVQMDPREWKDSYDMSVAVGLGTGNRDQMVGQLTNLLQLDERIVALQEGIDGPLLTADNIYEKLKRMVEAMGLKGIERYYTEPGKAQQQEPQPDPMAAEIQKFEAQAQIEIQKAQIKANTDLQIAKIKAEADMAIEAMKIGAAPMNGDELDVEAPVESMGPVDGY